MDTGLRRHDNIWRAFYSDEIRFPIDCTEGNVLRAFSVNSGRKGNDSARELSAAAVITMQYMVDNNMAPSREMLGLGEK